MASSAEQATEGLALRCSSSVFARALTFANRIVRDNNASPILANVWLGTEGKRLRFTGSNGDITVSVWFDGEIGQPGAIVVPSKVLNRLAASLPDDTVILHAQPQGWKLAVECGVCAATIRGVDPGEYIPIPKAPHDGLRCDPAQLKRVLRRIIPFVSDDEKRPELAGVHVLYRENCLEMTATDGYRLAHQKLVPLPSEAEVPAFEVILHADALREFERALPAEVAEPAHGATISVSPDGRLIALRYENYEVLTRLGTDRRFPNWRRHLREDSPTRITCARGDLVPIIRRISSVIGGTTALEISVTPPEDDNAGVLRFHAEANTIGELHDRLPCEVSGDTISFVMNVTFLEQVLAVLDTERVTLNLRTPDDAIICTPANDETYWHIIMPLTNIRR